MRVLDGNPGQPDLLRQCVSKGDAKALQFPRFGRRDPVRAKDVIQQPQLARDCIVIMLGIRLIMTANPFPLLLCVGGIIWRQRLDFLLHVSPARSPDILELAVCMHASFAGNLACSG